MKKVASLRYGVIFKKAFCDPDIFKAFARDVLDVTLDIDYIETEKSFAVPIGRATPRFDLFAEDKKNRIIVDIQHERYADHYDRFLYYHCAAILEQIASAQNHRAPLRVFTIVVLTSGDKHHRDVTVVDFDPKNLQGRALGEIAHRVVYLCPKYVNAATPAPYREWLQAINDSLDEEVEESQYHLPEIQRIFQYIEQAQISPDERARMIEEYHQQEKLIEVVKKMLAKGMAVSLIAELLDWGESDVLALKAEVTAGAQE